MAPCLLLLSLSLSLLPLCSLSGAGAAKGLPVHSSSSKANLAVPAPSHPQYAQALLGCHSPSGSSLSMSCCARRSCKLTLAVLDLRVTREQQARLCRTCAYTGAASARFQ